MVGFWLFMLIMVILIPSVMILFGTRFRKASPQKINYLFGYRTSRSMKNQETWEFAHHVFGKLWLRFGLFLFVGSAAAMLFLTSQDLDTVGYGGMMIVFLQCIVMVVPIFLTEHELKHNFDECGRRK